MDPITAIFSHLCGQGRCFLVDGSSLPVCQRCLGLYTGAALTLTWLLARDLFSRGFPGPRVMPVHIAALALAMAGGLHLLDPGPSWRFACGLWTGHVASAWLIAGASVLLHATRSPATVPPRWPRRQEYEGVLFAPALGFLALASDLIPIFGWHLWATVICLGAAGAALTMIISFSSLAAWLSVRVHRLARSI